MESFAYTGPTTLRQAVTLLSRGKAMVIAGGTDLLGEMQAGIIRPSQVVSLQGISGLSRVGEDGNSLKIGAMVTLADLEGHTLITERYPLIAEAARQVATPQLRAQGTIGGNLCQRPRCWYYRGDFPCLKRGGSICSAQDGENAYHAIIGGGPCHIVHPSDMAAALIAMGASVRITGPKGEKTVPLEKFYILPQVDVQRETILRPGELLTEILVPRPPAGSRGTYRKIREREAWDFALVSVAVQVSSSGGLVQEARVVLGGVAPIPWRAVKAEQALKGQRLTDDVVSRASQAAVADARPLSQNGYKVKLVQGLLRQTLSTLA